MCAAGNDASSCVWLCPRSCASDSWSLLIVAECRINPLRLLHNCTVRTKQAFPLQPDNFLLKITYSNTSMNCQLWIHVHRATRLLTGLQASIRALIFWRIDEQNPIPPSSSQDCGASQIIFISFSFERDLSALATVTGRVRNSLIAVAASGTLGNMEWCFINRVCAKSWTEKSSISFMVDPNALLNERTCSGKSADKPSLCRSAEAPADVYSLLSDFNKSSCGRKNPNLPATSCMPWNLCVTCTMAPCRAA